MQGDEVRAAAIRLESPAALQIALLTLGPAAYKQSRQQDQRILSE
jgi:hypothetical protein